MQDLLRNYGVYLDGDRVGRRWHLGTGRFVVPAGHHSVELRVGSGHYGRSDVLAVDIATGEARVVRATSLRTTSLLLFPLALRNPRRFAPTPWIRLRLEEDW